MTPAAAQSSAHLGVGSPGSSHALQNTPEFLAALYGIQTCEPEVAACPWFVHFSSPVCKFNTVLSVACKSTGAPCLSWLPAVEPCYSHQQKCVKGRALFDAQASALTCGLCKTNQCPHVDIVFCVWQGEMQVDQWCQVSSSGQDQGFMTMSVGGGVAQHFAPCGTSVGEHCLYSQTCSCTNRHQPPN